MAHIQQIIHFSCFNGFLPFFKKLALPPLLDKAPTP